jgi:hypothetical protein
MRRLEGRSTRSDESGPQAPEAGGRTASGTAAAAYDGAAVNRRMLAKARRLMDPISETNSA